MIDDEQGRLQVTILSATPVAESEIREITQSLLLSSHKKEVRAKESNRQKSVGWDES